LAAAALDRFCMTLGSVAGDMALAQGAKAVIIAGGLGRRLVDVLPRSGFASRFVAKGRFESMMAAIPVPAPVGQPTPIDRRRRVLPVIGWVATIAAAVLLSIAGTALVVGNRAETQAAAQEQTIDALEEVSTTALAVNAQPDGQHVTLTGVSEPTAAGSLAFSSSTTELVWLASGLTPPPAGYEYRCWVESGGTRQRIGKMFFSKDLAYWAGETDAVSSLPSGATFGLSLVDANGTPVSADPVMVGTLS
jgi:hypothetical protein